MKRKAIIGLIIMIILFGLVAWQPAGPLSITQPFITQDCQIQQIQPQPNTVSLETAVPSCWFANQLH